MKLWAVVAVFLCASLTVFGADALIETQRKAEQGDAIAQTTLGFRYKLGIGVQKESAEAVRWWRKAANQGHAEAQTNLGVMYATGDGV